MSIIYTPQCWYNKHREEIVGTVFDHIEECKQLDQKRHGDSAFSKSGAPKDPLITQLPDIDDAGFQLLRKNDQVIVCWNQMVKRGVVMLKFLLGWNVG